MRDYNLKFRKTEFLIVEGSEYARGFIVGKEMKKAIKKLIISFDRLTDKKQKIVKKLDKLLEKDYLPLKQEIQGRADGAGVNYIDLLSNFATDSFKEHCTSIMISKNGEKFLAHNEDGEICEDNIRFVWAKYNDSEFKEICYADGLSGGSILVRKNFIFSINYIWFKDNDINDKYLPYRIYSGLLANCTNAKELFEVVKSHHISTAIGINLYDYETNKMFYIEKVLNKYLIKEVDGVNVHTNHLLQKDFKQYVPSFEGDFKYSNTYMRQLIAEELIKKEMFFNAQVLKNILMYYGTCDYNSVFSKGNFGYPALTFCTFIFDAKNDKLVAHVHNKNLDIVDFSLK